MKLELNASKHGWNCSNCGLLFDSLGRPLFGNENISVEIKSASWIENKPDIKFCPGCGEAVDGDPYGKT